MTRRACRAGVMALVLAACAARLPEGHHRVELASGEELEVVTGPIGPQDAWTVWFLPPRLGAPREVRLAEVRQVWAWLQQDARLQGVSRVAIRPARRPVSTETRGERGGEEQPFVVGEAFVYRRDGDGWCEAEGFRAREAVRPCPAANTGVPDGQK